MKTRVTITLVPRCTSAPSALPAPRRTTVSGLIEAFLRSPEAAGNKESIVDEMLGSAELRTMKRGRDPLFDALSERHITRRG